MRSQKRSQGTFKSSQSWTDALPVCKNTGIGFSTNQFYREDGHPQEDHEYEDSSCHFKLTDQFSWYAVFDGHDGKKAAEFCSQQMTFEMFVSLVNENESDEQVKDLLRQAFFTVEKAFMESLEDTLAERTSLIYDMQGMNSYQAYQKEPNIVEGIKRLNDELSSGTAAAVALIYNNKLYVANIGNCRVLLCQTDQNSVLKVVQLSIDHDLTNEDELLRLSQLGMDIKSLRSSKYSNQF